MKLTDPGIRPLAIFAAVLGILVASSVPRSIGDGHEYLAVADSLSRGRGPSLTPEQVERFDITGRLLRAPDGYIDTIHFWAYPALAALPLAVARTVGLDAALAFALVNLSLLLAAAAIAARRLHWAGFVALFLSPILWWTDKVHTEAFTFSLMTLALCAAPDRPFVAAAALGLAAAQNPPIAVLLVLTGLAAAIRAASVSRTTPWRALAALGMGLAIAAAHPIFYWARLGRIVPLAETTARHVSVQAFLAVIVDANIGIAFNAPFFAAVVILTPLIGLWRGWWKPDRWHAVAILSAAAFLSVFARVVNINHGGTPGVSRHALWILPLAVPFLPRRSMPSPGRLVGVLAILGAAWSVVYYRPSAAESFLTPTRASAWLWTRHPGWTNPPVEIFAERLRHRENVLPGTAATPDCAKILLWDGIGPAECPRMAVPVKCERGPCYANRRGDGSYAFVVGP